MMIELLIQRLRHAHSPVTLPDFERIASHFGYVRDHVTGSHYVFRNWSGRKYVIPVHGKKVKSVYIRNFLKEQE
jgi:predicted RNA binding protein YcfA (HicA-like mRNA interferase family)